MRSFVKTPSQPGTATALFLVFTLAVIMTGTPLPLAAQDSSSSGNQALTLPQFGVTVQIPPGWGHHHYANVHELLNLSPAAIQKPVASDFENVARIHMGILKFAAHSDAVARLSIIVLERQVQPTFLTIGGWPALQRQVLMPKPERGEQEESAESKNAGRKMLLSITTAVAVGNSVFRMDGTVPADSPSANVIAGQIKQIAQGLSFTQTGNPAQAEQDLQKLQTAPAPRTTTLTPKLISSKSAQAATQTASQSAGFSLNTTLGGPGSGPGTEPEIAVSTNGQNIVIASQFGGVSSQDGGQTFSKEFGFPNTNCGDSSLAYGRSGNFYEGSISSSSLINACDSQLANVSYDGGKTFTFQINPFVCSPSTCQFAGGTTPNGVPDQEHIAADRFNAGPAPTAGDQVYFVWRNPGTGYGISCSSDSGATWTAAAFNGGGSADFPRITVGQDGTVYVVYLTGNIEVDTYTSCANGLSSILSNSVAVSGPNAVDCPIPGLDRCGGNGGTGQNDMRSHMLAVDDTNASHVYLSYASNTVSGVNEDIYVADSPDSGNSWSTPIQVNNSIPARRFMPWACSVGGTAYVSWYDRRNASPITNDATDYFATSVAPSGGTLVAASDYQINAPATSDPQCGIPTPGGFWPAPVSAPSYSESCYAQPQFGGVCGTASPPVSGDIQVPCDFATELTSTNTACPTGSNGAETCQSSRGRPKYGDYNGNACAAGRFYTVWGSATAQPGTTPPAPTGNIELFFSENLVCCVPQIQVPGPVSLTACSGTKTTATVNICNTGVANLQVNAISSSNSKITVSDPTSGYPLIVSADSCFPAEVTLSPGSSTGTISGTLTISSNDTVNPSATVQINGDAPAPSINVVESNGGNFGNVCSGTQSIQNIQITNQGQCNLVVSNITTSGSFLPPELSLPLTLSADATVSLPITFTPSTCSNTTIQTGSVTVTSNDPLNPTTFANLSGVVPCPNISATIANGGSFGNVCAGNMGGSNLQVLNTGQCSLTISGISSTNPGAFVLPTVQSFPLVLSADANVNLPITFLPSGVCSNTVPQVSTINIASNDPSHPILSQPVGGFEGCPTLTLSPQNLTGVYDYPATVSDPTGALGCYTDKQITVSNTGICPLNITSLVTTNGTDGLGKLLPALPLEFNVVNSTLPISVAPGAAPVPITVRFKPVILTDQNSMAPDQQTGMLSITSNDPVAGDNTAGLCGEPTYHSGARVLVVDASSNPVSSVKSLSLSSKGLHPNVSESLAPALLHSATVCGNTIQYQLDNETLPPAGTTGSNPNSSYDISAKQGSTQASESFTLGQCQMQQLILQIK
jgi:hypothetical protein